MKTAADAAPSKQRSWKQTRTFTGSSSHLFERIPREQCKIFAGAKPFKMDALGKIVKGKADAPIVFPSPQSRAWLDFPVRKGLRREKLACFPSRRSSSTISEGGQNVQPEKRVRWSFRFLFPGFGDASAPQAAVCNCLARGRDLACRFRIPSLTAITGARSARAGLRPDRACGVDPVHPSGARGGGRAVSHRGEHATHGRRVIDSQEASGMGRDTRKAGAQTLP